LNGCEPAGALGEIRNSHPTDVSFTILLECQDTSRTTGHADSIDGLKRNRTCEGVEVLTTVREAANDRTIYDL
jgi:hypothetical protein